MAKLSQIRKEFFSAEAYDLAGDAIQSTLEQCAQFMESNPDYVYEQETILHSASETVAGKYDALLILTYSV